MKTIYVKMLFLFFIFILFGTPVSVAAATQVSGNKSQDQIWSPEAGPYIISGEVKILVGATLTILPGTEVLFTETGSLTVQGTIMANGTAENHIFIGRQSWVDDPGSATPDNVTSAMGIRFFQDWWAGAVDGTFSYVDFRGLPRGIELAAQSTVTFEYCTFADMYHHAIVDDFGELIVNNSTFINGPIAGSIGISAVFSHEHNTYGTVIPGWQYDVGVGANETNIRHLDSHDGVYYLTEAGVAKNSSMIIDPGVRIYVADDNYVDPLFHIQGTLTMQGTAEEPIVVYSDPDRACTSTTPVIQSPWEWGFLDPTARRPNVVLEYVHFENVCGGIVVGDGTLTMNHVTMEHTAAPAAVTLSTDEAVVLKNSEISNSTLAIEIVGSVPAIISNNTFRDNDVGIHSTATVLDLRNNNWGSTNGPTIESNPDGAGDSIVTEAQSGTLWYCDWLGKPQSIVCPPGSWSDTPAYDNPELVPLPSTREPVVIIPGIIGTELVKQYDDLTETWPNLPAMIQNKADSQLDDLSLLVDGVESSFRPMAPGDVIRSVEDKDILVGLITELQSAGYVEGVDLFVFPYDWRLSNTDSAAQLHEKIDTILATTAASSVDIIAHSMGGIVAKEYIAHYGKTKIDQLFFVGTPHLGAPKAFKTLMYGDDMGFTKDILGVVSVPVLSSNRIFQITQNMPSVYELLPSERYVDTVGSYVADLAGSYEPHADEEVLTFLNYEQTNNFLDQKGRNSNFFENTEAVHQRTDTIDLDGIETYNFAACGATKTIHTILIKRKRPTKLLGITVGSEYELSYGAGDDTVPLESADAVDTDYKYYVKNAGHAGLSSVPAVRSAIRALLGGEAPELSDTLSVAESSCGLAGTVIGIHSPAALDIYTGSEEHTGPVNGDVRTIEYGIPGVQYDVIEHEKFAFLPQGTSYHIDLSTEATSTEAAVFDVSIGESNEGDTITTKHFYYNIPQAGIQTKAYLDINVNGSSDYMIHIDQDGDGFYESARTPAGTTTGANATDTRPPQTVATVDEGVMTLDAADADSGILETLYSIDDQMTWHHYANPVLLTTDALIYFFSVDNLGNTEATGQIMGTVALADEPEPEDPQPDDQDPENPQDPADDDPNDQDNHNEDQEEAPPGEQEDDTDTPGDTDDTEEPSGEEDEDPADGETSENDTGENEEDTEEQPPQDDGEGDTDPSDGEEFPGDDDPGLPEDTTGENDEDTPPGDTSGEGDQDPGSGDNNPPTDEDDSTEDLPEDEDPVDETPVTDEEPEEGDVPVCEQTIDTCDEDPAQEPDDETPVTEEEPSGEEDTPACDETTDSCEEEPDPIPSDDEDSDPTVPDDSADTPEDENDNDSPQHEEEQQDDSDTENESDDEEDESEDEDNEDDNEEATIKETDIYDYPVITTAPPPIIADIVLPPATQQFVQPGPHVENVSLPTSVARATRATTEIVATKDPILDDYTADDNKNVILPNNLLATAAPVTTKRGWWWGIIAAVLIGVVNFFIRKKRTENRL